MAPAKINLLLDIVGKREDGYHSMQMLNHSVDLCDKLTLRPATSFRVIERSMTLHLKEENLIAKAVRLLEESYGKEATFTIELEKDIPTKAGLGGGSSDAAAAMLLALEYWGIDPEMPKLNALAAKVGADVPYCLYSQAALVEGIGESVKPVELKLEKSIGQHLILIKPDAGVDTPQAFCLADSVDVIHPNGDEFLKALHEEDANGVREFGGNSFYGPICEQLPILKEIERVALLEGADYVTMSGSGSTMVCYFTSLEQRDQAYQKLCSIFKDCWVRKTEFD